MKTKTKITAIAATLLGLTSLGASALPSGKSGRPLSFHQFAKERSVTSGTSYRATDADRSVALSIKGEARKFRSTAQRKRGGAVFSYGK